MSSGHPAEASSNTEPVIGLVGVLAGRHPDETCGCCGCAAYRHTPCCGACSDCGNRICPEFDPSRVDR